MSIKKKEVILLDRTLFIDENLCAAESNNKKLYSLNEISVHK